MVILLFGVTGSGKTTIGQLLAADLGWQFVDADDHHSSANVAKMTSGVPLDDDDRREWIAKLVELIELAAANEQNLVMACSALKTAYRERLKVNDEVKFVLLDAKQETIRMRLAARQGHFMDPSLLQSQFDILETGQPVDVVIDTSLSPNACAARIRGVLLPHVGTAK